MVQEFFFVTSFPEIGLKQSKRVLNLTWISSRFPTISSGFTDECVKKHDTKYVMRNHCQTFEYFHFFSKLVNFVSQTTFMSLDSIGPQQFVLFCCCCCCCCCCCSKHLLELATCHINTLTCDSSTQSVKRRSVHS